MVKSTKIGQNFTQLAVTFDSVTQLNKNYIIGKLSSLLFEYVLFFWFLGGPNFLIVLVFTLLWSDLLRSEF